MRQTLLVLAVTVASIAGPLAAQSTAPPAPKPADGISPRCASPEHRQFDFWLGSWKVQSAAGKEQGQNTVERILQGCVVREQWRARNGSTGSSFSIYNPAEKSWRYIWVDSVGHLLELSGRVHGGKMVMTGRAPDPSNPSDPALHRLSWEPLDGGRIRQLYEISTDEGLSWSVGFDGIYVPAGQEGAASPAASGSAAPGGKP